jgi:hypothetical protein
VRWICRSLEDLDDGIERLSNAAAGDRPEVLRVSLSPGAGRALRARTASERVGPDDMSDSTRQAIEELGYSGFFYVNQVHQGPLGLKNAGVFVRDSETLCTGSAEAAEWAVWVLWEKGIPALWSVSQTTYINVSLARHDSAWTALVEDPEWGRFGGQLVREVDSSTGH